MVLKDNEKMKMTRIAKKSDTGAHRRRFGVPAPVADWPVLGGGFACARNLVRIFSSDCPNTPAAVLRTGAADLKADASAAGPRWMAG